MQQGLASVFSPEQLNELGLSTAIEPSLLQSQEAQVAHAHCDMLPPGMSRGMAVAQIARDATMALAMRAAAGSGAGGVPVVLLAGNGHVDELLGVPYWLARGAAESGERRLLWGLWNSKRPKAAMTSRYASGRLTVPIHVRPFCDNGGQGNNNCRAMNGQLGTLTATLFLTDVVRNLYERN
jgi:hypothetical protein